MSADSDSKVVSIDLTDDDVKINEQKRDDSKTQNSNEVEPIDSIANDGNPSDKVEEAYQGV